MIIETERLYLRKIIDTDDVNFFELDSDPEVVRFLGNKTASNIQESKDLVKYVQKQYEENGIGRWVIVEKETNQFVGWTGLKFITSPINNHVNYYDLGYRLIRKYWGNGFATESAIASCKYGFETFNINEIYSMTDIRNESSRHVLEKIGFQYYRRLHLE